MPVQKKKKKDSVSKIFEKMVCLKTSERKKENLNTKL